MKNILIAFALGGLLVLSGVFIKDLKKSFNTTPKIILMCETKALETYFRTHNGIFLGYYCED